VSVRRSDREKTAAGKTQAFDISANAQKAILIVGGMEQMEISQVTSLRAENGEFF